MIVKCLNNKECLSGYKFSSCFEQSCDKLLQSRLTLCDPMDYSLPRLLSPWDSPGKNTGVSCHALLQGIFLTHGSNLCFWTVVLDKNLEIPLDCKKIRPSILKEMSPEYSLKGLMLKLQYFCHLVQRTDSLEKTLMLERFKAGGEGDDRGLDGWMTSPTQWIWVWTGSRSWTGRPGMLHTIGSQRVGHNWVTGLSSLKIFYVSFH